MTKTYYYTVPLKIFLFYSLEVYLRSIFASDIIEIYHIVILY